MKEILKLIHPKNPYSSPQLIAHVDSLEHQVQVFVSHFNNFCLES